MVTSIEVKLDDYRKRKSYHMNKIKRTEVNMINMLEKKTKFVIVKSLFK